MLRCVQGGPQSSHYVLRREGVKDGLSVLVFGSEEGGSEGWIICASVWF